jgi:hypothetical protein
VNVESIAGGMRVQGDGLKVKIADVGGELQLDATAAEVVIDGAGSVVLKVDRGNAAVQRATGAIQASVTGGDVRIVDVSGPVNLELDEARGRCLGPRFRETRIRTWSTPAAISRSASPSTEAAASRRRARVDAWIASASDRPRSRGRGRGPGPGQQRLPPDRHVTAAGDIHLLGPANSQ